MIPTIKQICRAYPFFAAAERMKTGRPSEVSVHNVLSGVHKLCKASGLSVRAPISAFTRQVFDKCVRMINDFKGYYAAHNQVCYENPSPGNKAGGLTTLEDKSLGCVQKGGSAPVEDVLDYGECVKAHGLSLLTGPGNDLVASTVLAAAGCHLILFTTGRGTPFGCVVPTLKIASNDALAANKPNWTDWNAMSRPDVGDFAEKVLRVASGEELSRNEINGAQSIAIFKDGVTL